MSDTHDTTAPGAAWQQIIAPHRFTGKTIIVTGAGSGIGRATAARVALEGGRVIASDISAPRLDALVKEYPDLDIVPVVGDVADETNIARIGEAAGSDVHGLANVAGIMDDFTPAHEVSDEMWDRVFRINVLGTLRLTRAIVPAMLDRHSGSIVNVASEAGIRGSGAGVAYTASKHAVVGITKNSAVMYGPLGIRVNAVVPGATTTNIEATFASDIALSRLIPIMQATIPAAATAEQVAASICFLLSDDGTNVNGVILPSDGGWSAI